MGLAPGDVTYLRQKEQQLNTMLREAANDAGAGCVDTCGPSDGRGACARADVRWVEPLNGPGRAASGARDRVTVAGCAGRSPGAGERGPGVYCGFSRRSCECSSRHCQRPDDDSGTPAGTGWVT
ncbi:hypothetical protein OG866_03610 [Streptomyces sp. NBC_00663]|uniref:hypothetical protein n=1 Tax=Streptomyces sp. NBC_00663 TaxID=2975801 RepID=UPI002E37CD37|nr:hypothetical protein [Streptomyces sp. NBC_00663]